MKGALLEERRLRKEDAKRHRAELNEVISGTGVGGVEEVASNW